LLALAVGDFDVDVGPSNPVPVRLIRPHGMPGGTRLPLEIAAATLRTLSELLGVPYPFPKLDLVAVPSFRYRAMENAGLVTFDDRELMLEKGTAVWRERDLARVIAHEVAHQWTGDLVTARWWNDIWLNEGMATFLEVRALDQWRPTIGAGVELRSAISYSMDEDNLQSAAVREAVFTVGDAERVIHRRIQYEKGASFLLMIERFIGGDAFREALRKYLRDNAWKSVTTEDFVRAMNEVSHQDIAPFARAFLEQSGVPVIELDQTCSPRGLVALTIRQDAFRLDDAHQGEHRRTWAIPFCAMAAGVHQPFCQQIQSDTTELALEGRGSLCTAWVDLNPGLAGYYRYDVKEEQLRLVQPIVGRLETETKVGLLSNAWASVERHRLRPDALLKLLPAFDGEASHVVLTRIAGLLEAIHTNFVSEETEDDFRAYVAARMGRVRSRLGLERTKAPRSQPR